MGTSGVSLCKDDIIDAIQKHEGVILHAALSLGCHRACIYGWAGRDEDVSKAIEESRKQAEKDQADKDKILIKKAYESVSDLLDKRDVSATIYTLKTKGKWGEGSQPSTAILQQFINRPYPQDQEESKSNL